VKKEKFRVNILKFLNKRGFNTTASILAQVSDTTDVKAEIHSYDYDYCSATLEITDCSRKISIDLDIDNKTQYNNTISKLDLIIDSLTKVKSALALEFVLKEKRSVESKKLMAAEKRKKSIKRRRS